jgi:hypothetical protein
MSQLKEIFDKKFKGVPSKREGDNTDYSKGKTYFSHIVKAYERAGLSPSTIKRVFVTWRIESVNDLRRFLVLYRKESELKIEVLSFRDEILPELMTSISTSNYDDEVLRTISLIRQRERQRVNGSGSPR